MNVRWVPPALRGVTTRTALSCVAVIDQGYELGADGFACNGKRPTLCGKNINMSDSTNFTVTLFSFLVLHLAV